MTQPVIPTKATVTPTIVIRFRAFGLTESLYDFKEGKDWETALVKASRDAKVAFNRS